MTHRLCSAEVAYHKSYRACTETWAQLPSHRLTHACFNKAERLLASIFGVSLQGILK